MNPFPAFPRLFFALSLILWALSSASPAFSFGRREPGPSGAPSSGAPPAASVPAVSGPGGLIHDGDQVELSGRVRLVGSEPFPDLVLTGGDGKDWYLEGPDRRALQGYEQRTVKVRGRAELRELVLANGRSLGFRCFLRDVEITGSG